MRRALVVCLALSWLSCGTRGVVVEFRLAQTEPGVGLVEFVLPVSEETFYLRSEVAIGNADVASASVIQHGQRPAVELLLTQEGAARFAEFTKANLKRRVGIVVDGKLVSAPVINAPITGGRALVIGDFGEEEALRIARGLRPETARR
jgi:SecD/SecF fusion protein